MIRLLNLNDNREALQVLALQQASYRVEADIIGFEDIPPLMDSMDSLRRSGESFLGSFEDEELAGMLAYTKAKGQVTICRLGVHPDYFRKGTASRLLLHLEAAEPEISRFVVSTGSLNEPAVRLYKKHGFEPTEEL
ncbi:GNAT family N-acetyltransferase [Paenibacillus sp. CC-CFT747]|nr:GNAT family N-acetyltransferase [Paenibacillus sp. CC-CFT747]